MKTLIPFLAVLASILPAFQASHADVLVNDKISITGSIIQETGSEGQTSVKPITIANVLGVLGLSGTTPAKTLRYYLDDSTDSFVIAPKSLAATGTGTPIATVYSIDTATVDWDPSSKSAINSGTNTFLNGDLSGCHVLHGVVSHNRETDTRHFIGYGTISGMQTIMKGAIVEIYELAK